MKTILVDALGTFVIEGRGVYQPLFDLLESYPNQKIILTNANDEQLVEFGIVNMPYEVFSLKHNPDKDNPEYFKSFFAQYNLTPTDVIYFEHSLPAVESAKSLGIPSHHYDSDEKDLVSLKEFIDQKI